MKKYIGFLTAAFFALSSATALAQEIKVGVVDLQKIMQNAPQMKEIQASLEKEFKPRRDKLVQEEKKIKEDMEKFKRDRAVMSEKQRKESESQIIAAQQKFDREGQQYQQELSTAHNKAMENFYSRIRGAITKVATGNSYDVVLQKDAAPYSSEKLDITDQVMTQIK